jgi:DNA-binding MarR family transcriptional regulator
MKTKSALIDDINALIRAVGDKLDTDEGDAEREFIAAQTPKRLATAVRDLPTLSMHLLAQLEEGPVSVVGLAARAGLLKGTVSKHVQRLVDAGLVRRDPVPGNRKEVALNLTADGRAVAEAHRRLHAEMESGMHDFLARYTHADLAVVEKILRDLAASEKVGFRFVPAASAPERPR